MKLLDQVSLTLRRRRYSPRTEEAYVDWILRYIRFHGIKHPKDLGPDKVVEFLNYLATKRRLSASSQNQCLSALVFLYKKVLGISLEGQLKFEYARRSKHLPEVLSAGEVRLVLEQMRDPHLLMTELLYGSGLRLSESASLRVKDIDFENKQVVVRDGKGGTDRMTLLPDRAQARLRGQIERVATMHGKDLARGLGYVNLPSALCRKIPGAPQELIWQYLFPASRLCRDPASGRMVRYHLHETSLQKAVRAAAGRSGVRKRVTCHTFRHSFATHLLQSGTDLRTVQALLGHKDVRTTMVYIHLAELGPMGVISPLDR